MKVGELAKRTGVTVRTLHHYDEIGLLAPGDRTAAGHRVYGEAEVRRLQQIASLRHLGLPLDEIRDCLDRPDYSLGHVLSLHIGRIDEEMDRLARVRSLLVGLQDRLTAPQGVSVDALTQAIEATMSYEKHYTPEQLQQLRRRREEVGDSRVEEVQRAWTELFAAFRDAMERGLAPGSDEVKRLAQTSASLIREFTGGDPEIEASLTRMYESEGAEKIMASHAMEMPEDLWAYIAEARAAIQG
jgi:DNA-binding transcriptional MerR regulator